MVLIEAMTLGLPAVSFSFKCGPKDVIENGLNGLVVPEDDIPALAKGMQTLMEDPGLLERMSAEALHISEKYTEDHIMSRWENCFRELKQS